MWKLKTTFQMIGLGFVLISSITPDPVFDISLILLLFSSVMSWFSFIKYLNKWIV